MPSPTTIAMNEEIIEVFNKASGVIESWANGRIIATRPIPDAWKDTPMVLTEDGHETLEEYNKARPNAPLINTNPTSQQ